MWQDRIVYITNWNSTAQEINNFNYSSAYPYIRASAYMMKYIIRINKVIEVPDNAVMNRDEGEVIFMDDGLPFVSVGKKLMKHTVAIYFENGESAFPFKKSRTRIL